MTCDRATKKMIGTPTNISNYEVTLSLI
uniref:Uncharacterized protein n=1 Tax=Arundo donax TaxID=35708 RepID=A0A0A9H4H8_ARUDO